MDRFLISIWLVFVLPVITVAQVKLSAIFSDNMVLQQSQVITVWGTGTVNDLIHVKFGGNEHQFKVDTLGRWLGHLPAMTAGGPYTMEISTKDSSIVLQNVMIGEVWLVSGQSNMEFGLAGSENAEQEIAASDFPNIRFFQVQQGMSDQMATEVIGNWQSSNPTQAPSFSAVAYFFAKKLHQEKNVPVGIIQAAWGGTAIEPWIGKDAINAYDNLPSMEPIPEKQNVSLLYDEYLKQVDQYEHAQNGVKLGVMHKNFDDSKWREVRFPLSTSAIFKSETAVYIPGCYLWFRNKIELADKKADLFLHLEQLEGQFEIYFNGVKLDAQQFLPSKKLSVPKSLLVKGDNTIAIRIRSLWANGILGSDVASLYFIQNGKRTILPDTWVCDPAIEPKYPDLPKERNNQGVLFNAMIAPLIPYSIKGVLWYQGEANTWRPKDYNFLFPMLINDWRIRWKQGYFPFLFVQLANFAGNELAAADDNWAVLREAQRNTLHLPNTGMAVAIDVGDSKDIHPRNKKTVGERLYSSAQFIAYQDQQAAYSGPIYKSMEKQGSNILLSFYYTMGGLKYKGERLTGFTIAGEDGVFKVAKAVIVGDQVLVSSDEVTNPIHVRYGWSADPECNLYNQHNLPASPFRTAL